MNRLDENMLAEKNENFLAGPCPLASPLTTSTARKGMSCLLNNVTTDKVN